MSSAQTAADARELRGTKARRERPLVGPGSYNRFVYDFCAWTSRCFFELYGGVEVHGREHMPPPGPCLLLSNHVSFLDPPLIGAVFQRRMRWLARASLFDNPLFGGLIRALGSVPIERARLDRRGLQRASAIIEAGDSLVLFPEGTRGDGREVAVFERGYELLVRRARPTVVPVHLSGPERILPRKARWPRPAHCIVRVGEPFTAEEALEIGPEGCRERVRALAGC